MDLRYVAYVLDEAYERLRDVYVSSSVLGPVRLYAAGDRVDGEFWALFCALLDFGVSVPRVLNPMLVGLVKYMEGCGLRFVDLVFDVRLARRVFHGFEWVSGGGVRRGFTHRFVGVDDLVSLLRVFRRIMDEHGSLGDFVRGVYDEGVGEAEPMERVLRAFVSLLVECGGRPRLVPVRFGSALKRLNLFMRWMVRPYPDLGLWRFIDKRHLLVSLDEGLRRVLSRVFQADVRVSWRGVLEATRLLRAVNPDDPVKYDYLLSRLSIMGYCAKQRDRSRCYLCPVAGVCGSSNVPVAPRVRPLRGRESAIFEEFLRVYGGEVDGVVTEYPLGSYSADALIHMRDCSEYIVEVEHELNYTAIGQVVTYRYLYFKKHGKPVKPMIVCKKAPQTLREVSEREQGIRVVEVGSLSS